MLTKIAELLEVPVSQLLGQTTPPPTQENDVAELLARINAQLVIKNKRAELIWKVVRYILIGILVVIGLILLTSYCVYLM